MVSLRLASSGGSESNVAWIQAGQGGTKTVQVRRVDRPRRMLLEIEVDGHTPEPVTPDLFDGPFVVSLEPGHLGLCLDHRVPHLRIEDDDLLEGGLGFRGPFLLIEVGRTGSRGGCGCREGS